TCETCTSRQLSSTDGMACTRRSTPFFRKRSEQNSLVARTRSGTNTGWKGSPSPPREKVRKPRTMRAIRSTVCLTITADSLTEFRLGIHPESDAVAEVAAEDTAEDVVAE